MPSPIQRVNSLERDLQIKFETYRFYLRCIKDVISAGRPKRHDLAMEIISSSSNIQGIRGFDASWIERWMKIAWNTEYVLAFGGDDPELARINNQWKPIQAYYSVYAASEAVGHAIDGNKADGHQKALRKVTDFFVARGISPWNKAFKGSRGRLQCQFVPVNFPHGIVIPNNLSRAGIEPLQMLAKCLKAEHEHRINELFVKKPGLFKYNFDPGYTGLFHFLYRLRIKSNYRDVEIFVTQVDDDGIADFSSSLDKICYHSLQYMEIILIRKCKKRFILNLGQSYLRINPRADRLRERLSFYEENI